MSTASDKFPKDFRGIETEDASVQGDLLTRDEHSESFLELLTEPITKVPMKVQLERAFKKIQDDIQKQMENRK